MINTLLFLAQASQAAMPSSGVVWLTGTTLAMIIWSGIIATFLSFWAWGILLLSKKSAAQKLLWTLVILSLNIFGAALYFFIGRGDPKNAPA